ncbi:MAG: hypothetical protein IJ599_01180 [Alphaproteobacteria bacterium]|nr:hypothetical protein [Alphaproteobacteria bacterium]
MPRLQVKTHSGGGGLAAPTIPGEASLVTELPDTPCKVLARVAYGDVYKVHLAEILKDDKHPEWLDDNYKKGFYESSIWDYVRKVVADNAVEFNQNKDDIIKIAANNPAKFGGANWNAFLLKNSINRMFDKRVLPSEYVIDAAAEAIRKNKDYGKYWTNFEQTVSDVKLYSRALRLVELIRDIKDNRHEQTFNGPEVNRACFENYKDKNAARLTGNAVLEWDFGTSDGSKRGIFAKAKINDPAFENGENKEEVSPLSIDYSAGVTSKHLCKKLTINLDDEYKAFPRMVHRRILGNINDERLFIDADFFRKCLKCICPQIVMDKNFVRGAEKVFQNWHYINDSLRLTPRVLNYEYNRNIARGCSSDAFLIFPKWEYEKLEAVADNAKTVVATHKITEKKIERFSNEMRALFMNHLIASLKRKIVNEEFRKEVVDKAIIDFRGFQFHHTFITPFSILLMNLEDDIKQLGIKEFDNKKFFGERMKVRDEMYGMVLPCVKNVVLKNSENHSEEIEKTVNKVVRIANGCIDRVCTCYSSKMKDEDKTKIDGSVKRSIKELGTLADNLKELIKNSAEVLWLNGEKLDAKVEKKFFEKFPELRWTEKQFTFGKLSEFLQKVSGDVPDQELKKEFAELQRLAYSISKTLKKFSDADYYIDLNEIETLQYRIKEVSCDFKSSDVKLGMEGFVKNVKDCFNRNSVIREDELKAKKAEIRDFHIKCDKQIGLTPLSENDRFLERFIEEPRYSPIPADDTEARAILSEISSLLDSPTQSLSCNLRTNKRVALAYLLKIWEEICDRAKDGNLCIWSEEESASKVFQGISDYVNRYTSNKNFDLHVVMSQNFLQFCRFSENGENKTYPGFFNRFCEDLYEQAKVNMEESERS